jgi:hypothetical protein
VIFQMLDGDPPEPPPSPISKVVAIGGLFFPELKNSVSKFESAHHSFVLYVRTSRGQILESQMSSNDLDITQRSEAHKAVMISIREEMKKYYQSIRQPCSPCSGKPIT